MNPTLFIYKIYQKLAEGEPIYCGTAFPITPTGHFLTCYHVMNQNLEDGDQMVLLDNETNEFCIIDKFLHDQKLDIALLINPLKKGRKHFLPIIDSSILFIGKDVFTVGYYKDQGTKEKVVQGYFKGNIVNFSPNGLVKGGLVSKVSFPIIEGLSGSPLLTYHKGVKVVGMNVGNNEHRIQQSIVMEYRDNEKHFQETTNRIVEFGISLHPMMIVTFLKRNNIEEYLMTSEHFDIE